MRVIEAQRIGEGSSGVNGGQVIPGLKYDPAWLIADMGAQAGNRLADFVAGGADRVFDLIQSEALAVPHRRNGWIQTAARQTALQTARARAQQWQARGVLAEVLDAGRIAALTGARGYLGGWFDPRAGVKTRANLVVSPSGRRGIKLTTQPKHKIRQAASWA